MKHQILVLSFLFTAQMAFSQLYVNITVNNSSCTTALFFRTNDGVVPTPPPTTICSWTTCSDSVLIPPSFTGLLNLGSCGGEKIIELALMDLSTGNSTPTMGVCGVPFQVTSAVSSSCVSGSSMLTLIALGYGAPPAQLDLAIN